MDARSIAAWERARPFRPFTLHLDTGERFDVAHPDNLGFSPDTPVLVVFGGAEGVAMIDQAAVSAITHRDPLVRQEG